MFVQIFSGRVADEFTLWQALDRWEAELRPGAEGFLGSTAGVTKDAKGIVIARFDNEEAARRNSDRPEQGAWWAEAEKAFTGPVTFFDSGDVDVFLGGPASEAGFVQVMRGRGDRERARSMQTRTEAVLAPERPDIVGGITAWGSDGSFVDATYFRSETEARAGEAGELSDKARALFEEFTATMPVEEYLDLSDPRST